MAMRHKGQQRARQLIQHDMQRECPQLSVVGLCIKRRQMQQSKSGFISVDLGVELGRRGSKEEKNKRHLRVAKDARVTDYLLL